jgi:Bacterial Ig-like domain
MRFPGLGVAGRWLVVVFLLGGCNSLTNAPAVPHDGGHDSATHDGAGPAETGRGPDGAGGNQADRGSLVVVDAQLDGIIGGSRDDAAGPTPGLDAAGGFGGTAGIGGAGGAAGVTGDGAPAGPDANGPVDDGGAGQADGVVVVDLAPVDDRTAPVADGPGQDRAPDGSIPSVDLGTPDNRPPDVASSPFTVNAGPDQAICDGFPATIGATAQGGARPYAYAWSANPTCSGCISSPTSAQTDVVPFATTTFTVTAHDSLGAVATDSVMVTVVDAIANAGPEVSVDPGAPIRIGTPAQPGYTYVWTCDRPTCALSSATTAQPTVSPKLSTSYTVAVTSPGGCLASDITTVWVNLPVTTTPANGQTAYPTSASLFVQFGASVLASSLTTDTVNLSESVSGAPVPFTYVYNPSLHVLTITPTGYNPTVAQYTLTLVGGAAGILSDDPLWPQRLPDNVVIAYTLAAAPDLTAPIIVSRSPAPFATGIGTNTRVAATFSETLDPTSVTAANFALSTGATTGVAGTLSYDAKTATVIFVPAVPLTAGTTYTVRVSGIKDVSGNMMFATNWNFTTGGAADTTAPTVTAVAPASGATRVSATTVVSVTFSESVDPTTLAAGIQVAAGATPVAGSVTCDAANRVATFTPSAALASQTLYTVTVAGVKDLAGNTMTAAFTSTFTTTTILFGDSFEAGTANWTLPLPWGLTTTSYVSPTHSLTDSPAGNYGPNLNSSATSVAINVTNVPSVSLSYWMSGQTQAGSDFFRFEYSTNGGFWTTLDTWSGVQNWAQHSRNLTLPVGATSLQIRFRLTSNATVQSDGMYVDDVIVQAI